MKPTRQSMINKAMEPDPIPDYMEELYTCFDTWPEDDRQRWIEAYLDAGKHPEGVNSHHARVMLDISLKNGMNTKNKFVRSLAILADQT